MVRGLDPTTCTLVDRRSTCSWLAKPPRRASPRPPRFTSTVPIQHLPGFFLASETASFAALLVLCVFSFFGGVFFRFPTECGVTPQFQLLLFLIMTRITVITRPPPISRVTGQSAVHGLARVRNDPSIVCAHVQYVCARVSDSIITFWMSEAK